MFRKHTATTGLLAYKLRPEIIQQKTISDTLSHNVLLDRHNVVLHQERSVFFTITADRPLRYLVQSSPTANTNIILV